jgi:hypothetical protein
MEDRKNKEAYIRITAGILFLLMVWGIQQNFLSRQTENTFCRDKGNKYFPIYTTP